MVPSIAVAQWQIETVDSPGNTGRHTSLALDSSGYPHISYHEVMPNYNLKYAYYNGSSWQIEILDSAVDSGSIY